MSKLTSKNQTPQWQNLKQLISLTKNNPREIIIENPYTGFAGVVAGIIGLGAALFSPYAVLVVLLIAIGIMGGGILHEARKYQIYTQEALPLPIVINISNPANEYDALNSLFSQIQRQPRYSNHKKAIEKYLGITPQDLVYKYNGDIHDTKRLISFLQITKKLIEKAKTKTPQDSIIYLAYIGPISVGFLVGSMLEREGMIIFQRNQVNNGYEGVMTVRDRLLKEEVKEFQKFTVERKCSNPPQAKVTVAIDTASHRLNLKNSEIQDHGDLILLENKNTNTISFEEDWIQYVREVFTVLSECQQQYKEIKLIYSMPVSLGIAMGMAIGKYWNVVLTNYNPKTGQYKVLIKMNEVEYYF